MSLDNVDVHTTSSQRYRRCIDIETMSRAGWGLIFQLSMTDVSVMEILSQNKGTYSRADLDIKYTITRREFFSL